MTTSSRYDLCLYKAMFILAFSALLRIGEMAISGNVDTALCIDNIHFQLDGRLLLVAFTKFKHSSGRSHTLTVKSRKHNCLVSVLREYISLRRSDVKVLCVDPVGKPVGKPVTRAKFAYQLNKCLKFLGLDTTV